MLPGQRLFGAAQTAIFIVLEEAQALFQLVASPAGAGKTPYILLCVMFDSITIEVHPIPSASRLASVNDNSTPDFISWMIS